MPEVLWLLIALTGLAPQTSYCTSLHQPDIETTGHDAAIRCIRQCLGICSQSCSNPKELAVCCERHHKQLEQDQSDVMTGFLTYLHQLDQFSEDEDFGMDAIKGYQQLSTENLNDVIQSNEPVPAVWIDKRQSGSSSQSSPIKRSSHMLADGTTMEEKRAAFHNTLRLGKRGNFGATMRLGKRESALGSTLRLGKRSNNLGSSMRLGKRGDSLGSSMRLGKRAGDSLASSLRLGKRETGLGSTMRLGKRDMGSTMRLGKRDMGSTMRLGKRDMQADLRMGKRGEGLGSTMRLGKRAGDNLSSSMRLGKRYLTEDSFRMGKRNSADPISVNIRGPMSDQRFGKRGQDFSDDGSDSDLEVANLQYLMSQLSSYLNYLSAPIASSEESKRSTPMLDEHLDNIVRLG